MMTACGWPGLLCPGSTNETIHLPHPSCPHVCNRTSTHTWSVRALWAPHSWMLLAPVPLACAPQDFVPPRSTDVCIPGCSHCGLVHPAVAQSAFSLRLPSNSLARSMGRRHATNFVASQTCGSRPLSASSGDLNFVRHAQTDCSHDDHHQVHVQFDPPAVNCRGSVRCCIVHRRQLCSRYVRCLHCLSRSDHHRHQPPRSKAQWHQCFQRSSSSSPCPPCSCLCRSHSVRTSSLGTTSVPYPCV